ncbi:MAG: DUF5615 family PIN-like protein [Bacilli bacterium]
MEFLINANISRFVASALSSAGYPSVMAVDVLLRGASDEMVLKYSVNNEMVLITKDKADFGDLIFRQKHSWYGVVVLRAKTASNDDAIVRQVLAAIQDRTIGPGLFQTL